MKILKKVNIRTRLIILVTVMIIGILIMGSVGLFYNHKSNNALSSLYLQNITAIEKLSDARTQSRANFANILNLMVTDTEEEKQTILDNLEERKGKINDDLEAFNQLERDTYEAEQGLLIEENTAKWNEVSAQIIALVNEGKKEEAATLFKGSGELIFEELQTSIRDLVNYNVDKADTIYIVNNKDSKDAQILIIAIAVIACALSLLISIIIMRSITIPLKKVTGLVNRTSELDLTNDDTIDSLKSFQDEIGVIARSVDNLRSILRKLVENLSNVSGNLAASSKELAASTEESTRTINQVVSSINEIAIGNNSQAEMVVKTSDTVLTMAENIHEVNKASGTSSVNAKQSLDIVMEGNKAIDVTMKKMKEIIQVSDKVEKSNEDLSSQMEKVVSIIDVIRSISERTTLLALNASIEAARAGVAGRGFAVVASEINKLSMDTSKAVNEITDIISMAVEGNKISSTNAGVVRTNIQEQETTIQIMKEAFERIQNAMEDISKSSISISERIVQIDSSVRDVSNQTQDMSAVAEESASSSEEISATTEEQLASIEMIASAANDLSAMAIELKEEISKFKL